MVWAVTPRHSGNSGTTAQQTHATAAATPTANSLFLVFFGAENNNHANGFNPDPPTGGGWTYTQRLVIGDDEVYQWNATTGFRIGGSLYTAPIDGSPGSHTVTVDAWSGLTSTGFYGVICCDVTGYDTGNPIRQVKANGANIATASDNASGTVTFDSTPLAGNLVIACFFPGADTGGSPADPTAGGGGAFTDITVQNTSGFTTMGAWSREWSGAESNATITCADMGQQVGNYTAFAIELNAESAAPWPPPGEDGPDLPGIHRTGLVLGMN